MPLATAELIRRGETLPMLVGGEWRVSGGFETKEVTNPATGEVIAKISYGGRSVAKEACDVANSAFSAWATMSTRGRSDILLRASELIAQRAPQIGELLSIETGKLLNEAVGEVRFSAEYFKWFAEEIRRPRGEVFSLEDPTRRQMTITRPIGVVASLTPWNFPISIQARKLAPALAAGCSVVARPSEKAPVAVSELFRALVDAGVPDGVVNLIYGSASEQSYALIEHPGLRAVSFTGSTEVGSSLMRFAADRIVRCSLELGGDAPFIIFADADLDAAIDGLFIAKFRNNGQSCIAANRVLVSREVFDEVVERIAKRASLLKVGDRMAERTVDIGPLIDSARVRDVASIVGEALSKGASFIGDSPSVPEGANYFRPGFLKDVPRDCRLARDEVFGPIAGVFPFDSEQEALELANDTEMGLAGYAYSKDSSRIFRIAEGLNVGILGLNHSLPSVVYAPMGGVKRSGLGREGAHLGLEEFTETTYLSIGVS